MGPGHSSPRDSSARDVDRRVVRQVVALLAGRPLNIHHVADSVRMSIRTLQRRLRGAGVTYDRVVQSVRFEIAEHLLQDPQRKIGDVARTLGYSDPAHFTRAFRRWTGLTPRDFRRRGRSGAETVPNRRQTRESSRD
jgi:AraC-like DNA-binding protein